MSLKGSWSSLAGARVVVRFVTCAVLACVLTACGGREQQQEERARRARQMRDVSRMLDAMEANTVPAAPHTAPMPPAPLPPFPASTTAPRNEHPATSLLATIALAVAGGVAGPAFATFVWRRRKRLLAQRREESPRKTPAAAPPPPAAPPASQVAPSPPWVYRSSAFETPPIRVANDPVDLLAPAVATAPSVLAANVDEHAQRTRSLPRREADAQLSHAERDVRAALDATDAEARPTRLAQWMRTRLAGIERLSGATRLFAVRDIVARVETDPAAGDPVVIDARIDVQLAWASWVRGDAAASRLVEAERLCAMLHAAGGPATALALRRKGEIFLRRADLAKGRQALSDLERAQACLDEAHTLSPDADTALLVARTALQRARSLSPADAANACAHALVHAFLAEQEPACRTEALACRLAIQLTYATLAIDDHHHAAVAASLGRDLEASGPLAPSVRMALAETCLREGNPAKTARLCESVWNDGGAQPGLLDLWRDACHGWSGIEGRDRVAHARSLRLLAIARSTL